MQKHHKLKVGGSHATSHRSVLTKSSLLDLTAGKNRLHLDLRPIDQEAEVSRLEGLGARRVSVGQATDVSWVVMADPEGNEFCVLQPLKADE